MQKDTDQDGKVLELRVNTPIQQSPQWYPLDEEQLINSIGAALQAIPTGALRGAYLSEKTADFPAVSFVKLLHRAQLLAVGRHPHAQRLLFAFDDAVVHGCLRKERMAALVTACGFADELGVLPLLKVGSANRNVDIEGEDRKLPAQLQKQPVVAKHSLATSETLGRRKTLARTAKGDKLTAILADPHPDVIANALLNPYITEPQVVRVAARRPLAAGSFTAIAQSRFRLSPIVRRAMANNPYCPPTLACQLLSLLPLEDLRDIAENLLLGLDIRKEAQRFIDEKKQSS